MPLESQTPEIVLLLIVITGVVNLATRAIPIVLMNGRKLPRLLTHWCQHVAVPVLSAMVACEIFYRSGNGGRVDLSWTNPQLAAALPAFFVAYKTRSLALTVISGVLMLALLRAA